MLPIGFIRDNAEKVRKAAAGKNDRADIDSILQLDADRRSLMSEVEKLRSTRNEESKNVARIKKEGGDASELIAEMARVGDEIKKIEDSLRQIDGKLDPLLLTVPNIPADDVQDGRDANDNDIVREHGEKKKFSFTPLAHWDIGEKLGILDFGIASKISGSGFAFFKGKGALLERALYNFMLDLHTTRHGYKEVFPPFLVNRDSMTGTGQLPKLEEDMYRTSDDDLFLIPTAEVPVTNIHRDDMLSEEDLPICYTAYTACFRREAGSYGKDTRGLLRVHQFDKVEMVKFVRPDTSWDELEKLLQDALDVVEALGLQYRVLRLCTGELSFAAAKCYDIETYAPGVDKWLEISSCSNFTDFQARRANIRFRTAGKKTEYVHTLNGSGVALARTVIAILENYQREDGSVEVPDVLRPYMGGLEVIEPEN